MACNVVQFFCTTCNNKMTGPEAFQAHLVGKRHKNKVNSESADGTFHCDVCDLECTGQVPWRNHLGGSKHKKNQHKAELENSLKSGFESCTPSLYPSLKEFQENSENKCSVCDIICTGIENLQAHIKGKKHMKQVRLNEFNLKSFPSSEASDVNHNVEDSVTETADIVNSPDSEKNDQNLDENAKPTDENVVTSSETMSTVAPTSVNYDTEKKFDCSVCGVPCTGPESYIEHLRGRKHARQLKVNSFDPNLTDAQIQIPVVSSSSENREVPTATGGAGIPEAKVPDHENNDQLVPDEEVQELSQASSQGDEKLSDEDDAGNADSAKKKKANSHKFKNLFKGKKTKSHPIPA